VTQHFLGVHALELVPAQSAFIDGVFFCFGFIAVFRRIPFPGELGDVFLAGKIGVGLLLLVKLVEALHEKEIGDLFDGGQGLLMPPDQNLFQSCSILLFISGLFCSID